MPPTCSSTLLGLRLRSWLEPGCPEASEAEPAFSRRRGVPAAGADESSAGTGLGDEGRKDAKKPPALWLGAEPGERDPPGESSGGVLLIGVGCAEPELPAPAVAGEAERAWGESGEGGEAACLGSAAAPGDAGGGGDVV
jgi:hypothetical protein